VDHHLVTSDLCIGGCELDAPNRCFDYLKHAQNRSTGGVNQLLDEVASGPGREIFFAAELLHDNLTTNCLQTLEPTTYMHQSGSDKGKRPLFFNNLISHMDRPKFSLPPLQYHRKRDADQ
jgi:hypothetical protein